MAAIANIKSEIVKREKNYQSKRVEPTKGNSSLPTNEELIITSKAFAAAEAGDVDIQVLIGSAYLSGTNGMPQDIPKGARYMIMAAAKGHPMATFVAAGLYADGTGVQQNLDKATILAVKAKSLGVPESDQMLAVIDAKRGI